MAKLSGLRTQKTAEKPVVTPPVAAPVEAAPVTPPVDAPVEAAPVTEKKSAIASLKQVETPKEEVKAARTSKGDSIFEGFFEIISDGKPHKIKDLLDHFSLPHTSSGREKLRQCKRKIETSGGSFKEEMVDNAKAISLVIPEAAPVAETN